MSKKSVLQKITQHIIGVQKNTPILVCVDGVDGAGKTHFAKDLAAQLDKLEKKVILCSVDDFHNPKKLRYQRGADSPEGFYHDSYNYIALKEKLLEPFSSGQGEYIDGVFDVDTDNQVSHQPHPIHANSILLLEGIFLQRPELVKYWDVKIFLEVDFKITLERNIERATDQQRIGSAEKIIEKYNARYRPGQEMYMRESDPKSSADIVVDNSDFENPKITKNAFGI